MTAARPPEAGLGRDERHAIIRDGIAVGLATGAYGISFGAISVAAGLTVSQTCVMSLLVFTGASQFALVGVIASGGTPFSGAVTALLLGTRNTLYGLRLAPLLQWRGWRRVVSAQLLMDESTAMSVNRSTSAAARVGFLSTGLAVFALWNLATLGGAVGGKALGDPRTYGLDAAVGGAFLALLWPRLSDRRNQLVAILAVALALSVVPVTAAGVPVLAAGLVAALIGAIARSPDPTEIPSRDQRDSGEHP
ncbi:MAG TPA: AzlC family ABC transporter permease [Nocardioidaceae bacterium]|nr:AzlC family ABC transporter permease [Nocardioidaceae bacterium]